MPGIFEDGQADKASLLIVPKIQVKRPELPKIIRPEIDQKPIVISTPEENTANVGHREEMSEDVKRVLGVYNEAIADVNDASSPTGAGVFRHQSIPSPRRDRGSVSRPVKRKPEIDTAAPEKVEFIGRRERRIAAEALNAAALTPAGVTHNNSSADAPEDEVAQTYIPEQETVEDIDLDFEIPEGDKYILPGFLDSGDTPQGEDIDYLPLQGSKEAVPTEKHIEYSPLTESELFAPEALEEEAPAGDSYEQLGGEVAYRPPVASDLEEDAVGLLRTSGRNWMGILSVILPFFGLSLVSSVFAILGMKAYREGKATNKRTSITGFVISIIVVLSSGVLAVYGAAYLSATTDAIYDEAVTIQADDVNDTIQQILAQYPDADYVKNITGIDAGAEDEEYAEGSFYIAVGQSGNSEEAYLVPVTLYTGSHMDLSSTFSENEGLRYTLKSYNDDGDIYQMSNPLIYEVAPDGTLSTNVQIDGGLSS